MKAKQVRFAENNTLLAPPAGLAMMSRTSSGSSVGPFTPPFTPPMYVMPPKAAPRMRRASMPAPAASRVHPVLEATPSGPILRYNLVDPPSGNALTLRSREVVRSLTAALNEPVTNPPVQYLTINCPHLPWTIRVTASSLGFVSVNDVLVHVYHALRKPITPSEYALLGKDRDKERAAQAYRDRYRRLRNDRDYQAEKAGGMRRVDFLMERSRFGGLTRGINSYGEEGWVLSVMK